VFEPEALLWFVPLLPLLGAAGCALMGGPRLRQASHLPCVIGAAGACVVAALLVFTIPSDVPAVGSTAGTWFEAGPLKVTAGLVIDPLSSVMLLAITFIGFWIAVFSVGYMRGDPGYSRYFAVVSLFLASMTLLVLADNFVLLFGGWEGVGLCSYLLIGHWYAKPSAAAAARKAFLVTRLGDVGLVLGAFLLWSISSPHTFQFQSLFANTHTLEQHHDMLALACLLVFFGAVGKSAQFPLYVWLPDAMEGPTPVSALIHAATMVTAGVYLLARCAPLFVLCPGVQLTVSVIGAVTALLAAYIALTQTDLKRVLAYSTVSQLGFMFMALGAANSANGLARVAVAAAIFHLFTHAFFKAVLFLSAGSVMHGMGNVIDMRRFSGLRRVLPITHVTFLCGAAALAGVPLLSGFWSKDSILEALLEAGHDGPYSSTYTAIFYAALLTAALTAFYTFRAYFRTFWGPTVVPAEAGDHAHESPSIMTVPLVVLAVGAVFVGIVAEPFTHWFSDFLGRSEHLAKGAGDKAEHHLNWGLMLGSGAVALVMIGLAYYVYVAKPGTSEALARRFARCYRSSLDKLYVDEIYDLLFVRPLRGLAYACQVIESLVFDVVRLVAALPRGVANLIRPLQNGLVQFYALTTAMGVAAFIGYLVFFAR
jgi:proton-translocating NADH-quinone oxidoreductase chain L